MQIVGVTGSIGSGKTTFAEFLADNTAQSQHFESWLVIAEVANQLRSATSKHPRPNDIAAINRWLGVLPSIVSEVCTVSMTSDQLQLTPQKLQQAPENYAKLLEYLELVAVHSELQEGEITEESKETFRTLLQWLGGYFEKEVHSGIWYGEIVKRIENTSNIELATVGGVRFPADARKLVQAGGVVIRIDRPSIGSRDAQDLTEREHNQIVPDATVINDAGLPELRSVASKVWKDLSQDKLVTEYTASETQA